jgi:hypothetical protein
MKFTHGTTKAQLWKELKEGSLSKRISLTNQITPYSAVNWDGENFRIHEAVLRVYMTCNGLIVNERAITVVIKKGKIYMFRSLKETDMQACSLLDLFVVRENARALNLDWLKMADRKFLSWDLIYKILRQRITNSDQLFRHWLAKHRLMTLAGRSSIGLTTHCLPFLKVAMSSVNSDTLVAVLRNHRGTLNPQAIGNLRSSPFELRDLSKQAAFFNRTYDLKWSMKRLNQLHSDWSLEIEALKDPASCEPLQLSKYIIEPAMALEKVTSSKLLRSPMEIRAEGVLQRHCVGSYVDRVKEERYLVFKDGEYTVSIQFNGALHVEQIKGLANRPGPLELIDKWGQATYDINQKFFLQPTNHYHAPFHGM